MLRSPSVTSELAPAERESRIINSAETPKHVLVATDCLCEGINLQGDFDAVLHYDLSWNPTRHEQREGRVDRYGQPSPNVRVGYLLRHRQPDRWHRSGRPLRKHKKIRSSLGISVPVPVDTETGHRSGLRRTAASAEAWKSGPVVARLRRVLPAPKKALFEKWESAPNGRNARAPCSPRRGLSASVEEVERELAEVRRPSDLPWMSPRSPRTRCWPTGRCNQNGVVKVGSGRIPRGLRDALHVDRHVLVRFLPPATAGELLPYPHSPRGGGTGRYLLDTALDPKLDGVARRCGAIRTRRSRRRTTVLLLRLRYHIITRSRH